MIDQELNRPVTRRTMLAGLASMAFSLVGVRALAQVNTSALRAPKWDDKYELAVNLEIAVTEQGFRTHRPYVAVYIEDPSGKPVRTVSLWVQNYGRGQRYVSELRRWYHEADTDLVGTVSSATRNPGVYALVWNGRDDKGNPVDQGQYFVVVEAAREHGTYQLMRQAFNFTNKPFKADLGSNTEIKSATLDFRRKA